MAVAALRASRLTATFGPRSDGLGHGRGPRSFETKKGSHFWLP